MLIKALLEAACLVMPQFWILDLSIARHSNKINSQVDAKSFPEGVKNHARETWGLLIYYFSPSVWQNWSMKPLVWLYEHQAKRLICQMSGWNVLQFFLVVKLIPVVCVAKRYIYVSNLLVNKAILICCTPIAFIQG